MATRITPTPVLVKGQASYPTDIFHIGKTKCTLHTTAIMLDSWLKQIQYLVSLPYIHGYHNLLTIIAQTASTPPHKSLAQCVMYYILPFNSFRTRTVYCSFVPIDTLPHSDSCNSYVDSAYLKATLAQVA